jgi:hypothetical protein
VGITWAFRGAEKVWNLDAVANELELAGEHALPGRQTVERDEILRALYRLLQLRRPLPPELTNGCCAPKTSRKGSLRVGLDQESRSSSSPGRFGSRRSSGAVTLRPGLRMRATIVPPRTPSQRAAFWGSIGPSREWSSHFRLAPGHPHSPLLLDHYTGSGLWLDPHLWTTDLHVDLQQLSGLRTRGSS